MTVSLSFDFEECDLPREDGRDYPFERGMAVSVEGAEAILDVLARHGVRATFFCTLNFAIHAPAIMRRLVADGHEIASHGVDHFSPSPTDPVHSKAELERLTGRSVVGYRQPRMTDTDDDLLVRTGYRYSSSLNPAFVPGRYMHLTVPRKSFVRNGLRQVPVSVTPHLRFPLFWLSLHLLPEWLYRALVWQTLRHDGVFVTYFHPWEFSPTLAKEACALGISPLIRRNLGARMTARLDRFVASLAAEPTVRFLPIAEQDGNLV